MTSKDAIAYVSYGDMCPICGIRRAFSEHHTKPRAEGGTDDSRNKAFLCAICHDIVEEMYNRTGRIYSCDLILLVKKELICIESREEHRRVYMRNYYRKLRAAHRDEYNEKMKLYMKDREASRQQYSLRVNLAATLGLQEQILA